MKALRSILAALALVLVVSTANAQESIPEPVVRHYQTAIESTAENGVEVRVEFHLLIGTERTASLVLGGEASAPEPSYRAGIAGFNEFEAGDAPALCITIDSVWGPNIPESLIGQRACWIFDEEADTMAPINDPDNMVMQRARVPRPPQPQGAGT